MSNNKDFHVRSEWIRFLNESSTAEVHYFGSDDIKDDVWLLFKKERPITAHILEELFGHVDASGFAMDIDENFTEHDAIRMLGYIYRPQPSNSLGKKSRLGNISNNKK